MFHPDCHLDHGEVQIHFRSDDLSYVIALYADVVRPDGRTMTHGSEHTHRIPFGTSEWVALTRIIDTAVRGHYGAEALGPPKDDHLPVHLRPRVYPSPQAPYVPSAPLTETQRVSVANNVEERDSKRPYRAHPVEGPQTT